MTKRTPLDRLEESARRLVEGSFDRLLGGRLDVADMAAEVARAVRSGYRDGAFPTVIQVELNPADYAFWHANQPDLARDLAAMVTELARRYDVRLLSRPQVDVTANTALGRNAIAVRCAHIMTDDGTEPLDRSATGLTGRTQVDEALRALDAFVVVAGRYHVVLDKPLMRIGRKASNDIVVNAPTVSRRHAQLRWRFGRFILVDLGSRGGTTVNGRRVDECVLHPGDVIGLSDQTLIYGEGSDETRRVRPVAADETQLYTPRSADGA